MTTGKRCCPGTPEQPHRQMDSYCDSMNKQIIKPHKTSAWKREVAMRPPALVKDGCGAGKSVIFKDATLEKVPEI